MIFFYTWMLALMVTVAANTRNDMVQKFIVEPDDSSCEISL